KWANERKNRAQYGSVISDINEYYTQTNENARHNNYLMLVLRSSTLATTPYRLGSFLLNYINSNEPKREELKPALEAALEEIYQTMHLPLERDVLINQLNLYAEKGGN